MMTFPCDWNMISGRVHDKQVMAKAVNADFDAA